jgi:hypothetical protein
MDLLCAFSHLVLFWYSFRSCRLAISHRRNRKLSLLQLSGNLVLASSSKSAAVDPTVNVGTQAPVSAVLSPSIAPSLQTVESADLEVIASKFNAWFAAGACASAFTSLRYATISDQFVSVPVALMWQFHVVTLLLYSSHDAHRSRGCANFDLLELQGPLLLLPFMLRLLEKACA